MCIDHATVDPAIAAIYSSRGQPSSLVVFLNNQKHKSNLFSPACAVQHTKIKPNRGKP
jgi:hypothetical protein